MKNVKFKTNINCGSCVKSVTPFLNKIESITSWKVDTNNNDKVLSVELNDDNEVIVIDTVKNAGFEIEKF
jgi:copper chaperone CopZ